MATQHAHPDLLALAVGWEEIAEDCEFDAVLATDAGAAARLRGRAAALRAAAHAARSEPDLASALVSLAALRQGASGARAAGAAVSRARGWADGIDEALRHLEPPRS